MKFQTNHRRSTIHVNGDINDIGAQLGIRCIHLDKVIGWLIDNSVAAAALILSALINPRRAGDLKFPWCACAGVPFPRPSSNSAPGPSI